MTDQDLEELKHWYANKQLKKQVFYLDDKIEGEYKEWYRNGQLEVQEFYRDGKREGKRK